MGESTEVKTGLVVESITQAFSQQPEVLAVSTESYYNSVLEYEQQGHQRSIPARSLIKEIRLEKIWIDQPNPKVDFMHLYHHTVLSLTEGPAVHLYYVGYSFEGKRLFMYLYNTVNVKFKS